MPRLFLCFLFFLSIFNAISSSAQTLKTERTFLFKADKIYYNSEEDFAEAIGNVEISNGKEILKSDRALIDIINKKIWASGYIIGKSSNKKMIADSLFINEKDDKAIANNVMLKLNNNDDILAAKLLVKKNENEIDIFEGSYTPCKVCYNNKPLWQIDAKEVSLDFHNKKIIYHHGSFKIAGFRVAYLPYFSHAMPDANSKSGILKPEIDKGTFKIPFYLSISPNKDLTYTPRFNRKLLIHELEYRHLIENGSYQFNGSYSHSRISKQFDNGEAINKKYHRYYVKSFGDFQNDHFNYGYNLSKVSDKSYLKNYYQDYRSFIKSEIYLNNFIDNGYNHIDVQHYQGLRKEDNNLTDPSSAPNFEIKRNYDFDNNINLSIYDNGLQYFLGKNKNITRNSLGFEVNKNFFGDSGQSFIAGIHNRIDFYNIEKSKYNYNNHLVRNKNFIRNVPEFKTNFRWPLFLSTSSNLMVLEPEINFIAGSDNLKKIHKYSLIDSPNYEINENNIFENSRYSGIDYYEEGRRFSYGINNYIMDDKWQVSGFLGQMIRSTAGTSDSKSDYIGKIAYTYDDFLEIYYRFQRKNKHFQPHRDEIAAWLNSSQISFYNNWTTIRDLKEFSSYYNSSSFIKDNVLKQNYSSLTYKLTDNFSIFGDLRLDLSQKNNLKILSDSVGTTYNFDCIAFTVKITNDYMNDPSRNIKKNRTYGIKLGLKTVNM